jgi:hypothetical protein
VVGDVAPRFHDLLHLFEDVLFYESGQRMQVISIKLFQAHVDSFQELQEFSDEHSKFNKLFGLPFRRGLMPLGQPAGYFQPSTGIPNFHLVRALRA